jgi:hypothetical protein
MAITHLARKYTGQEDAFIRANYKKGGMTIKQIAKKLNRGFFSVEKYLRTQDIRKEIHRPWTENDIETLRINYNGNVRDITDLAGRMNRTFYSLEAKAGSLGLTRVRRKFWDKDDIEFLRENTGRHSVRKLSEMMKRSANAIVLQMKTLGLHRKNRNGWYTTTEAAEIMGCSKQKIAWLIRDKKLFAKPHYDTEHSVLEITRKAMRRFICTYPAELQGRNVDMVQLIDVLTENGIRYNLDADGD